MSDLRLRARTVTEIVDAAFQLYRRDPLQYLLVAATAYAPLVVVQILIIGASRAGGTAFTALTGGVSVVLGILGMLAFAVITTVLNRYASEVYLGRTPDVAAIVQFGLRKVPSIIGASILLFTAMMLGGIPLIAAIATKSIGFGVLAFFVAAAWGIYVFARFFAVFQVIALEERGVIEAFVRSSVLSRRRKGKILATYILLFVIMFLITIAISILAVITRSQVLQLVLQGIASMITYPLLAIGQMLLYYDARINDEGFDIEMLAGALGAPSTAA